MLACQTCGVTIEQEYDPKKGETKAKEERKTLIAAKSNKEGPYCSLCHYLEMARRYAEHRGLKGCVDYIRLAKTKVR